ncbi:MAG TPA: histidine kinase dimerization/phospho-acceptor domain-containing protein, partial [Kofleriaceae bacterium]
MVELEGIVKLEDEILTMSARMAAITGDPFWEGRYHAHDAKIDAAFVEMIALSPSDASETASASSTEANKALSEMEMRAFDRVRAHDLPGAQQVLFSGEYERQKQACAAGMTKTMALLDESIEAAMQRRTSQVLAQTLVGAFLLLLAVGAWVRAVMQLRSREKRLATALADSQQAQAALREAMSALEKMHVELIAKEKLSSIGLLAAGVAHEINNPMAYVTMNVHALLEDLREAPNLPETLQGYVEDLLPSTIDGISRVNTIVRDLQQFAR